MNNLLNDTFQNGTTIAVVGMIGRVETTGRIELAKADTLGHLAGTVGVVRSGSVAAATNALEVATHGHQRVLLETGLTPVPGDVVWVSATVAGRGTNVQPGGGNVAFPIGTIKSITLYATKALVSVDVNSLASVFAAAQNGSGAQGAQGASGAQGSSGAQGATGAQGGATNFAMFYGLTAGTGNGGATDYAGTIAAHTAAGTGRVPFPRLGPTSGGGIAAIDASSFTLPAIGTYHIIAKVHTTEPGQLQLELAGAAVNESTSPNMNPTAGGHPIVIDCFVTTVGINAVLAVINPAGNSPALTITTADGASTHANAQSITIQRIA